MTTATATIDTPAADTTVTDATETVASCPVPDLAAAFQAVFGAPLPAPTPITDEEWERNEAILDTLMQRRNITG